MRVAWNSLASFTSEEAWRANAGEARETSWSECFAECSLAAYFTMAFVFPLMAEAAFGWQRGTRPGFCLIASLVGMMVVRMTVQMAPLPFSMGWYVVFVPALLMVVGSRSV